MKTNTASARNAPGRRGTAAVELALVLPVLVLLVLGCIDFGRFPHVHITVTNAACAGAEFAGTHPYTPATYALWQQQVRQAVVDEMSGLSGFDPALLTVTITIVSIPNVVARAIIDVSYPFDTVVGWPGLPQHVALDRVVSMPASRP